MTDLKNLQLGERFIELAKIMATLRHPVSGCPWDLEQNFSTIAPYTIEEAYEVADAIERGDMADLCSELGDLLLQVVFHARIAEEAGVFALSDVVCAISDKMIRRHPHVFSARGNDPRTAAEQTKAWEDQKAEERAEAKTTEVPASALDGVALALPALMRAEKIQKRAARTGFDWPDTNGARAKIEEELLEIEAACQTSSDEMVFEEAGDLLFSCVNYLRKLGVDPESALRHANAKFEARFKAMESLSREEGLDFSTLSLSDKEDRWKAVKAREGRD